VFFLFYFILFGAFGVMPQGLQSIPSASAG